MAITSFLPATSLRRKIILGYVTIGSLLVAISLAGYVELHQLENRMAAGSAITDFLNAILEMRRYEKNFFLYKQPDDHEAFRLWVTRARDIVRHRMVNSPALLPAGENIEEKIQYYDQAMAAYVHVRDSLPAALNQQEEAVRVAGKDLVTLAEEMAAIDQQHLFQTMARHRQVLLLAIGGLILVVLVAGHILTRMVTRPLKQMETTLRQVADGQLGRIALPSRDLEILSLTQAFNRMIMELRARQKRMVQSEKLASLGTMLSGVAHELNNPLSNIATSCQILLEEPGMDPFHRELLEQIDSQTLRARDIVRSLLDFARDRPFLLAPVAVGPLVEEAVRLVRVQVGPAVTVLRQVEDTLMVSADRQRLQQALINLIKNGVDAMQGTGEILVAGRALAAPPDLESQHPCRLVAGNTPRCSMGPVVEILVRDQGGGIDPAVLPRILDPFFTTKETGQGFGLGLFVTHEIIEEHGGCLVVDAEPGEGATFRIYLPGRVPLENPS